MACGWVFTMARPVPLTQPDRLSKRRPVIVATGMPDAACGELAREQHGVISRAQARDLGFTARAIVRRLESGRWETMHPAVYRIAGSPSSWEQRLMAGILLGGPGALASHRAAAELWELAGVPRGLIEIATPRRLREVGVIAHGTRRSRLRPADVDGIPRTDVARTLLDLGAVVPSWVVESALDDALRRHLTSLRQLRARLQIDGGRGRRGAGVVRALLEGRDPAEAIPESVLETRLARLIAEAYLPPPIRQYEVRADGVFIARIDFAWPEALLALEADGYATHSARADWRRDRTRRNALTERGWLVLHATWEDVTERPNALIQQLRRALHLG